MQTIEPGEKLSLLTQRMMRLLLNIVGHGAGVNAPGGLPIGSLHIADAGLILANTTCTVPLFGNQMRAAAEATQADVLLMRHGLFPETVEPVFCDVLLYLNGCPTLIADMLLYYDPEDGFWLVPGGIGPHIAIEDCGLRVAVEPPFISWSERADGLCRAAHMIVQHARGAR